MLESSHLRSFLVLCVFLLGVVRVQAAEPQHLPSLRMPGMEFASEMVVSASLAHLDIR